MVMKIDYDRGVMKNIHPTLGTEVYMYMDDPGVFLSAHATPVSDTLAKAAGFDVEALGKRRLIKERMAAAADKINKEIELGAVEKEVVQERQGFKIISLGALGRHNVESPDGILLNKAPIPLEQAEMLLKELTPEPKA